MTRLIHQPDPRLDLVFERIVDVPPELVWVAWTTPEHVTQWFTPEPWKTVACEIDLRPGGIFRTVMRSPEGQEFANIGCYLEIIKNEKLIWTNALAPGYRPSNPSASEVAECGLFLFTAIILLERHQKGTKYTALVIHRDEAGKKQHEEMGFHEGWGKALDQLVAYMKQRQAVGDGKTSAEVLPSPISQRVAWLLGERKGFGHDCHAFGRRATMLRHPRFAAGDFAYHVLNRRVGRVPLTTVLVPVRPCLNGIPPA